MESHLQIDGLLEELREAKERQDGARKRVDPIVTRLQHIEQKIADAEAELSEVNTLHDQMNRHITTQNRRNQRNKAAAKRLRRNAAGAEKSNINYALKAHRRMKRDIIDELRKAKAEVNYDSVRRHYYSLRHRLMMAVNAADQGDESALQRKAFYRRSLVAAGFLPETVTVDELLYYEDGGKIQLFYGGRKSYDGDSDVSPDGHGHGHYVLDAVVHTIDGLHKCIYARHPS